MTKKGALNRDYVSDVDQFLLELSNSLASKSASRVQESETYKKIFDLRDKPKIQKPQDFLWKEF